MQRKKAEVAVQARFGFVFVSVFRKLRIYTWYRTSATRFEGNGASRRFSERDKGLFRPEAKSAPKRNFSCLFHALVFFPAGNSKNAAGSMPKTSPSLAAIFRETVRTPRSISETF